ncbi:MAG: Cell division protein FtsK/SpoIIIE [Candidatus Amesbacteria bacterium GW2011_GWB1_47_19]|nr:MAG: Cell division protein FtsK/SpoIIIE [Candidatus Amesbacteria bacterium GW2011_GWC1_46_24]KKU66679.1 MAG: Cell division protein FtsK/SpoIIIE [Candidatus Amesbacteria bacterium GW2011_GWB1_47_19]HBC72284.1 DNA translocase FtsK [Candidatus Amesbacteria bacterium]
MARRHSFLGRKNFRVKLKKSTVYSITAVLLFSVAGLIWVSFLKQGIILTRLNSFLITHLGLPAVFLLPFPLLTGGLMITKIKAALSQPHVFIGSLILITAIAGLSPGSLAGREMLANISLFLSVPGAYLFLLTGLGIGLIIMLNIPFEDLLNYLVKFFAAVSSRIGSRNPVPSMVKIGGMADTSSPPKNFSPLKTTGLVGRSDTSKSPPAFASPPAPPASAATAPWHYPPLSLLSENISGKADRGNVNTNAATIEKTLEAFGITAKVVEVNLGPAVTQYALEVAIGTKLSKISALGSDLALALAAPTGQIRIEAPIPGRAMVGIELPNRSPEFVSLRKILESDTMKNHKSKLAVAMGLDVSGSPVVSDIGRMPHILIAGATGSGKSVCINAFIASLLFRASPQELKLIMVDPKRVELTGYNGIPHLLSPVIVEPRQVLSALNWAMMEMDNRYKKFAEVGVRNLEAYNELAGFQSEPYIIIFVDELADIMLFAPVEVEDAITRIAQMARATGIHLVISTQRPSVDIITGLIKANIPARIAFAVSSMIDSRVIIDGPGAEKLLGRGDMLYIPPDQAKPSRIQGAFVSDREIRQLIDFLKKQGIAPHYTQEVTTTPVTSRRLGKGSVPGPSEGTERDTLFEAAFELIIRHDNASASFLQRKLSIGYARAARILDELQQAGVVGPADGSKPREILLRQLPAENSVS